MVKYEFDAGVLGDTALLTAVGVPSFLLLPGFLVVVVFCMLWNHVGKRERIPLDVKSPEFWSLAVLLSLTSALIYPLVWKRNYLEGYNFKDIYRIWFGSAGVAVIAWGAAVLAVWIARWERERAQRRCTFSSNDNPVDVLHKLELNHSGFRLDQVELTIGGEATRGLLLFKGQAGSTTWVAPRAVVSRPADSHVDELSRQIDDHESPGKLIALIEKLGITARWKPSGRLSSVTEVQEYKSLTVQPVSLIETE